MKILQLTVIVRDVQTATMVAQSFTRSPVLVGRQFGNQLRLDARMVSRRHGAFLFSNGGLQYIDYHSANGTFVDGIRVQPNTPIDIRTSSVITIAPFQIVAQMNLVDARRIANDPNASTPTVSLLPPRTTTPEVRSSQQVVDRGAAIRGASGRRDSSDLLARATRIIEIMCEGLFAAGSRTTNSPSPLRLAASPDEMVAMLLESAGGDRRLNELRELLGELLRPRLKSLP